jgi:hypothetical protein
VWGSGGGGEDVTKTLGLAPLVSFHLRKGYFRGLRTNLSSLGAGAGLFSGSKTYHNHSFLFRSFFDDANRACLKLPASLQKLRNSTRGLKEEMKNPSHGETFPNTSTKPASKQHLKQPQSLIYQPSDIPMDLSIKMADVTEEKEADPKMRCATVLHS